MCGVTTGSAEPQIGSIEPRVRADIEPVETSLNSDVNVAAVDVVFPVRVENSLGRCGLGDPDTDHGLQ